MDKSNFKGHMKRGKPLHIQGSGTLYNRNLTGSI